jgi:beta-lactamase superfamily II metal-dependent hydrolase
MFRVEMLPAGKGDALFVEYGPQRKPHRILIDGGVAATYPAIRKRLSDLRPEHRHLDLIVISHVDTDHIDGIIRLLQDTALGISADDVWFNSWRHLTPDSADLLGPVEGEILSALIQKRRLPWNSCFKDDAVSTRGALPVLHLDGGMKLTVLSPTPAALSALRPVWAEEVRKNGLHPDHPEAALEALGRKRRLHPPDLLGARLKDVAALAGKRTARDTKESNASSIAFLAEYDGKSCLFAADAVPAILEASFDRLRNDRKAATLSLDAMKVSHHGSKKNVTLKMMKMLNCPRFLISTNGDQHGHPDDEAVARIIQSGAGPVRIYFNYLSEATRGWLDDQMQRDYQYDPVVPSRNRPLPPVEL